MIPAVQLEDITRIFSSRFALRNINLTINEGEVLALTGHNGSGKTTLLRLISTLLQPSSGRLKVFGKDSTKNRSIIRRKMGILFTENFFYGDLTVLENLRFYGTLLRVSNLEALITTWLERLEIQHLQSEYMRHLSKGEKQRVSLIRSLLHNPHLLLWDEPTSGLDQKGKDLFQKIVLELKGKKTLLCVTHERSSIATWADREVELQNGEVR